MNTGIRLELRHNKLEGMTIILVLNMNECILNPFEFLSKKNAYKYKTFLTVGTSDILIMLYSIAAGSAIHEQY